MPNWIDSRNIVITTSVLSAIFLFGIAESMMGVSITTKFLGFTIGTLLAIGQSAIVFFIVKRYV